MEINNKALAFKSMKMEILIKDIGIMGCPMEKVGILTKTEPHTKVIGISRLSKVKESIM